MKSKKNNNKKALIAGVAIVFLMVMFIAAELIESHDQIQNGIYRGTVQSEIYEETFVARTDNGEKQHVDVVVFPRQLTEEQCQELIEKAILEFEQTYLGENESADAVWQDLVFQSSFCDGMVTAVYTSDAPLIVWEDGSVSLESVAESGRLVALEITFLCQETQVEYNCYVNVKKPEDAITQSREERYIQVVQEEEKETRDQEKFVLPKEIAGEQIHWSKKIDSNIFVLVVLGGVAIICLRQQSEQFDRQQQKIREKMLLQEYPHMVTQISLLMGAGMPITTAWERMVKEYLQKQIDIDDKKAQKTLYLEEMLVTYRMISEGVSIRSAIEEFGVRVGLPQYRKLSALLVQNMRNGTKEIVEMLDVEAGIAVEDQKRSVRKQGEETGTKLLFPMLLLFLMVLIAVMYPAIQNF